ncbi:MAG: protein kinase [Anaerolineales bacterium]|nr:protein kinase [Anaerolineales bacterium]
MTGETLGKYRLTTQLGTGGMAEVYKAYQPGLDRYVAIKVLYPHYADDSGFVERFEREAALVARLRHPNIVQVFDFDVEEGRYYMVMELIEGPTLSTEVYERIRNNPSIHAAFSPIETVSLFGALASAVDYAHTRNMVHRDLKPSNIMFTADGQVVLTDFGIARMIGEGRHTPSGGRPAGTPFYMAPEVCQGQPGDHLSDIYALGVILYGLMTNHVPFEDGSPDEIMRQHAEAEPPSPTKYNPEIPAEVERVIMRALAKAPENRYQSANAVAQALREAHSLSLEELTPYLPLVAAPETLTVLDGVSTPMLTPTVAPTLTLSQCPYRGLFAFREEDAAFFFGREDFTDRLSDVVEKRKLVGVIGPSGSGKSSVVFAGLVPRLRQAATLRQARGQAWAFANLRPSARPFEALAAAFVPEDAADRATDVQILSGALRSGSNNLGACTRQYLGQHPDASRLLVVVDQFEELFTLGAEPDVRRAFLDVLLEGMARNPALHIIFTLRADFLSQAFSHRPYADALQDSTLILGPMTRSELGRAIEEPARKQSVRFQSGLMERILDDVADEPGNLPLLEFALTALWDKQIARQLNHAAYDEIGQVAGALARYADDTYQGLSQAQKDQARSVFVQLVRPGENTEDTRRQATRTELGANWPLVQELASARLIVTNREPDHEETAEIVHEALIRSWGRLRDWMRANRTFRAWQERLRGMMQQWEVNSRDDGALLRGALLVGAEGWLAEREAEIGAAEREFIRTSISLREKEMAERE